MVLEIFELTSFYTDDEDVFQKVTPHFGIIIFVHKSNQGGKQKLPFLIIPTQKKETQDFFLDQLSKVHCGFKDNISGLPFIKFTFKIQQGKSLKESNLLLVVEHGKFLEIWSKVLPHSKRPRIKISKGELKSRLAILRKANEISKIYEDLTQFYNEKTGATIRNQMMYSIYANFMTAHASLNKKQLLSKLREEEFTNLPKFVKTHSEISPLSVLIMDSYLYTYRHRCNLHKCKNFGLKKCSRCRFARYCNTDCQNEDWKYHAKVCQRVGESYSTHSLFVGDTLMDIMKRCIPGDVKLRLTFEEFTALLSAKIFELNFELITEEVEGFAECRNLLRGAPAKKEDVKTQLEEVWGKNEMDKVFHIKTTSGNANLVRSMFNVLMNS